MSEKIGIVKINGPNERFKGAQLYLPKPVQTILNIHDGDQFLWRITVEGNRIVVVFEKITDPTKVIKMIA